MHIALLTTLKKKPKEQNNRELYRASSNSSTVNTMMENLVFTVFILVCKHLLRLIVGIDGMFAFVSVYSIYVFSHFFHFCFYFIQIFLRGHRRRRHRRVFLYS